jgi:hypothetical protein
VSLAFRPRTCRPLPPNLPTPQPAPSNLQPIRP